MKKILIVMPDINRLGGVSNHYLGLKKYFLFPISYIYYGRRSYNSFPAFILFFFDIIKYIFKLIFFRIDIVIINPSFRRYQLFRDGIYLIIGKIFQKKIVTFIHGWDNRYAVRVINNPFIMKSVYNNSLYIYTLYSGFKKQLRDMGIKVPILLTTTKVDDVMLNDFDIQIRNRKLRKILFLARIEKNKGIIETIDVFRILKDRYNDIAISIVGDGRFLQYAKEYAIKKNVKDISFHGGLKGEYLVDQYMTGDIYILPTTHGEGMPTSVLEAMAFGLPIITRPVGGLNDFFENDRMGYLIESLNPQEYADKIIYLIENSEKYRAITHYNYLYAKKFFASNVARKIEEDIVTYTKNTV